MHKEIIDWKILKEKVLNWLESLRIGEECGRYRICREGQNSLYTSCAAAFIQDLLGDLDNLEDRQKKEWIAYIQNRQDSRTGYFSDINRAVLDNIKGFWERDYILEQMTQFSVMALSAFNSTPLYPLKFLNHYKNKEHLLNWLKALNWKEPWYQSNKVMFKLSLLIDDYERNGSPNSKECALTILDWLDSRQDPHTGLWATDLGVSKYHGVFTTFHFMFFYFYLGRKIHYIEKIIDSALSIQNRKDGLFSPHGGGGACPDLDAVDVIVKCGQITEYRNKDIAHALEKAFYGLVRNQNKDGGFCWVKKSSFTPLEWFRSLYNIKDDNSISRGMYTAILELIKSHLLPKGYHIHYAGLKDLAYRSNHSDVFSTWFRLLTIALIDTKYPNKFLIGTRWKFSKKAVLGWHSAGI